MLERAAHQALMEFCERHLQDEGNPTWSRRLAIDCDTARQTYHVGWAFTARYAHHMSSLLQVVMMVGTYQCMRLEEYNHQVEAKDHLIDELRKGNREVL
jgi:hypothetical protein